MSLLRISSLLLTTLLLSTAKVGEAWYQSTCTGGINIFGGDANNCINCAFNGDTVSINLADYHDGKLNIFADRDDSVQCVKYWLKESGESEHYYFKNEKIAPFSLYGNDGGCYFGGQPLVGLNQTLFVCDYSDNNCDPASKIGCMKVTLDITDTPTNCEPNIQWIDFHDAVADNGYYDWLPAGDDEVCVPPSGQVAIAASTCNAGCIDQVYMKLVGPDGYVSDNFEVNEPFSLYENCGMDFFGGELPPGDYTITAVPNADWSYEFTYDFTLVDCSSDPPSDMPSDMPTVSPAP